VLVALIAIGAVIAVLLIHRSGSGPGSGAVSGGGTPSLSAVTAYDPQGTGVPGEHNADAPKATDHNGDSYWETEFYSDAPSLPKDGVGLVLDAGRDVQLQKLGFATETPGFTAEIKAGDSENGPFPDVVAGSQVVGRQARFTIASGKHRYYLIWITRLGGGYHTARINEVSAT
jgi:hypothetical protein